MNNKQRVRKFYEDIFSNKKLDLVYEFVSDSCVDRDGNEESHCGVEGMKKHINDIHKTYANFKVSILRQIEDGDYVISEVIGSGKHTGEFLGIPPTGQDIEITAVDIDKVVGGKIVEHGGAVNTFDEFWAKELIKPVVREQ